MFSSFQCVIFFFFSSLECIPKYFILFGPIINEIVFLISSDSLLLVH